MNDYIALSQKIKQADAILIGACNGFSITEGINLFASNQAFFDLFGDIARASGIQSILHGMMNHWPSEEEKWGFWSRLVDSYCSDYKVTSLMSDLQAIVGDTDHFILTTNGECHFEMAGFEHSRVYEVEGTWLVMQCASRCHETVYPSFDLLKQMAAVERDGRVPTELIPRCPQCGSPMNVHMAADSTFIPNRAGDKNFRSFLERSHDKHLVILELGVGPRNSLVKQPLMQIAAQEPNATYATFNLSDIVIPAGIAHKSFGIAGYLDQTIAELRRTMQA